MEVGFPKYITRSITVLTKQNELVKKGDVLGKETLPNHPDNSYAGLIVPKLSIIKIQVDDIIRPYNSIAIIPKNNNNILSIILLLSFIFFIYQ